MAHETVACAALDSAITGEGADVDARTMLVRALAWGKTVVLSPPQVLDNLRLLEWVGSGSLDKAIDRNKLGASVFGDHKSLKDYLVSCYENEMFVFSVDTRLNAGSGFEYYRNARSIVRDCLVGGSYRLTADHWSGNPSDACDLAQSVLELYWPVLEKLDRTERLFHQNSIFWCKGYRDAGVSSAASGMTFRGIVASEYEEIIRCNNERPDAGRTLAIGLVESVHEKFLSKSAEYRGKKGEEPTRSWFRGVFLPGVERMGEFGSEAIKLYAGYVERCYSKQIGCMAASFNIARPSSSPLRVLPSDACGGERKGLWRDFAIARSLKPNQGQRNNDFDDAVEIGLLYARLAVELPRGRLLDGLNTETGLIYMETEYGAVPAEFTCALAERGGGVLVTEDSGAGSLGIEEMRR